jgi:hypothetical protein
MINGRSAREIKAPVCPARTNKAKTLMTGPRAVIDQAILRLTGLEVLKRKSIPPPGLDPAKLQLLLEQALANLETNFD